MQKAMLLMTVVLAVNCGAAVAEEAPVFQLDTHEAAAKRLLAVDAYPSNVVRDSAYKTVQTASARRPARLSSAGLTPTVRNLPEESNDAWVEANAVPVNFSRDGDEGRASGTTAVGANTSDDTLFYFLKNFKAQPLQKPERWTMYLVGLCFVLYQIRRRPMRTSIGFQSALKLVGHHGV